MKRFVMMMVMAVALVLAVAPIATYAQGVEVGGTGTLTAEGDGRATLYGGGTFSATSGAGQLWIYDRNGDAEITVTGEGRLTKTVLANGDIRYYYRGFKGTAAISGSDVGIILKGLDMTLTAEGTGRATLYGSGTYTVNGESGVWSYQGVRLNLGNE
jgi:hypothetical protein